MNNNVGIFFQKEANIKVSIDKWTLLVYKNSNPIKRTIENNDKSLDNLLNMNNEDIPRTIAFKSEVRIHTMLLRHRLCYVNQQYTEILADSK